MRTRTTGRTLHRASTRKPSHTLIGAPPQFHEHGAPEDPPLPDEFNRFAPTAEEADAAQKKRHKKHLMMILLLTGGVLVGFSAFGSLFGLTAAEPESTRTPTATLSPDATEKASAAQPSETPKPADASSEAPIAAPTPEPTETPTPAPTPEPEVEGVWLMKAYWTEGDGAGANFVLSVRIPKKNAEAGIMLGDFYAWLDGPGTVDNWDAIMTPSEYDTTYETDENGDQWAIFLGTLYWPNRVPAHNSAITIAATGFDPNTGEETELSNALTVHFGELMTVEEALGLTEE